MYFWNIKQLKQQLASLGLSERQMLYYIVIAAAYGSLAIAVAPMVHESNETAGPWSLIGAVASVVVPLAGILIAYVANGGDSGTRFAERYFSISLVATIRSLAILCPVIAVQSGLWWAMHGFDTPMPEMADQVRLLLWEAGLCWYIAKNVRDVASA